MTSHRPSRAPQAPRLRGLAGLATAALVLAAGAGCAGARTTSGWQDGLAGAGVIQPLEYAAVMLAVPSRTPGMVTNSMAWRSRCLRHSCVGVRSSSRMVRPLAGVVIPSHNRHTSHSSHMSSDTRTTRFVIEP